VTRIGQILRAAAAFAMTAALLAGLPWVLYRCTGSPIPRHLPAWAQAQAFLATPLSDQAIIRALATAAWLLWLVFATSLATEAAAVALNRRAPRLPGIAPVQALASALVGATLMTALPQVATHPASLHRALAAYAAPADPTAGPASPAGASSAPSQEAGQLSSVVSSRAGQNAALMRVHLVRAGDNLWDLAEQYLGDGERWHEIYSLNKDRPQPGGEALIDPRLILPGWLLLIPAAGHGQAPVPGSAPSTSAPPPATPPAWNSVTPPAGAQQGPSTPAPVPAAPPRGPGQPASPSASPSTPTAAHPARTRPPGGAERSPGSGVGLPSGAIIGTGLVVLIGGVAIAAARLHMRRARTPSPVPGTAPEPPPLAPALHAVRHAYLADERNTDGASGPDEVPRRKGTHDDGIPPRAGESTGIVSAGSIDGQEVSLDLTAAPGFGVTGPGADAVIRALAVTVLAQRSRDQAQVILCGPGPAGLLAGASGHLPQGAPGLTVARTPDDGLTMTEAEITRRRRLLEASGTATINDFRAAHPDEDLSFTAVIAAPDGPHAGRLEGVLKLGAQLGIAGIVQGRWTAGSTCKVAADGWVQSVAGAPAESLEGARMFQLQAPDAPDMLTTLAAAAGASSSQTDTEGAAARPLAMPPAESLSAEGRPPAELSVLGAFKLTAGGAVIARGLRRKAAELLVYLALHPDGATTHELLDALWPDTSPERASPILHAATSNVRNLLRSATRTPESAFIVRVGDRMRIDAREVGSDLWHFQGPLAAAASAPDDEQRREALEEAASLWRGDFADGMDSVWIEEHRETLRRDAVDVLARLAELWQEGDPERALASLERAITIDRYQEALYQRIMMVQAMLGRRDAARRTYQLLDSRLSEIDAEPEESTGRLLHQILHDDGS